MPQAPTLDLDRIVFGYPGKPLFAGLSARFEPGLSWIRGANGCGKSTLLRLIAGGLRPEFGSIRWRAEQAAADPLAWKRMVYWCGPGAAPFDHLTPAEFFGLTRSLYPGLSLPALETAIDGFGLRSLLHQPLSSLSSGSSRKTWMAAGLAADTPILLLDEPFNALDSASATWLHDWIDRRAQADTAWTLVASHVAPGTRRVDALVLGDGRFESERESIATL